MAKKTIESENEVETSVEAEAIAEKELTTEPQAFPGTMKSKLPWCANHLKVVQAYKALVAEKKLDHRVRITESLLKKYYIERNGKTTEESDAITKAEIAKRQGVSDRMN